MITLSPILEPTYNVTLTFSSSWNRVRPSAFPPSFSGQTCDSLGTFVTFYAEFCGRDGAWLSRLDGKRHCDFCSAHWNTLPWSLQLSCRQSSFPEAQTRPCREISAETWSQQEVGELPQQLPPAPIPCFSHWGTPSQTHPAKPSCISHPQKPCVC